MGHTTRLQNQLDLLATNDPSARDQIVGHAIDRLRMHARMMLQQYPGVRRWAQTDDVLQNSVLRLHRALSTVKPETPEHFYRLAAQHIQWELKDLNKRFKGPLGIGANHLTNATNAEAIDAVAPADLDSWTRFHEAVERLPPNERAVVDLLWYDGLSQTDAAKALNISLATLKRRWAAARITLAEATEIWEID